MSYRSAGANPVLLPIEIDTKKCYNSRCYWGFAKCENCLGQFARPEARTTNVAELRRGYEQSVKQIDEWQGTRLYP